MKSDPQFRPYRIKFIHDRSGKELLIDLGDLGWSQAMHEDIEWLARGQYSFTTFAEAAEVALYLQASNNPGFSGTFEVASAHDTKHLPTVLTSTQV